MPYQFENKDEDEGRDKSPMLARSEWTPKFLSKTRTMEWNALQPTQEKTNQKGDNALQNFKEVEWLKTEMEDEFSMFVKMSCLS